MCGGDNSCAIVQAGAAADDSGTFYLCRRPEAASYQRQTLRDANSRTGNANAVDYSGRPVGVPESGVDTAGRGRRSLQ
jgi:hypothetical protein